MNGPDRLDTSRLAQWWITIDRTMLAVVLLLLCVGGVLLFAAGPATAARLGISNSFHFSIRQFIFLVPALVAIFGVSMLSPLSARRLGSFMLIGAFVMMLFVLLFAPEINGSRRWIPIGGFSLQPSEMFKPGFVIVAAWMLAEGKRDPTFPGVQIAMGLYLAGVSLLVMQPDYGQAALLTAVWMVMFFIAGWSTVWLIGLGGLAAGIMTFGYFFSPHLARRINGFFDPTSEDNYQVNKAVQAISEGGLTGTPMSRATVKMQLPDAHSDFIFAVAGEQYGFFFCLFIIALFLVLVMRAFSRAAASSSVFVQCAASGLGAMIGLQAFVNMGVSLRALPAKGMTLPFISYGGSSLLMTALTVGLLLALTRRTTTARRRRDVMP